jgi:lanthanide-dependent methanol dehydrogenase
MAKLKQPGRLESASLVCALVGLCLMVGSCKERVPEETPKFPQDMLKADLVPFRGNADPNRETVLARPAAGAVDPDDGQWVMPLKDYAGTRFSALTQIDTATVAHLQLAWHYDFRLARGQEATPIVVNNTMYVVTSFPNLLYAFDLTKPGPAVKWVYDPKPARASQGVACCDLVNRGAVYADGKLIYATLDNQAVAVDANTGAQVWKTTLGNYHRGETMTMAPIVVKGLAIFGNAGAEFGIRGWLKAVDIATGQVRWTAWSTGSDADVLIGPRFRPFYEKDRGINLGIASWPAEHWKIGGGTVWGWVNYDPRLDLIYYGTANAAPWNPDQRPGDNKWAATIFARRPDTGEAVWAYQWDPHNVYDWDGVNESMLLDMPVDGRMRQVMVRAERNGFVYVIDRATGEVLSATPYMHGTVVKEIDRKSGLPIQDWKEKPRYGATKHGICPAVPGAKDFPPTAFSPQTGLLYIPATNLCMDIEGMEANYIAGTPYMGASVKMYPGPGGHRGEMIAWDPVNKQKVWALREKFVLWSGPLATAGDVVFYGTMDRQLKAVNARTGKLLWKYQTATGIIAPPITYRGPDNKQYVAVMTGPGGWPGSVVSVPVDPRDETADKGFAAAMYDLPDYTGRGGHLYVFALP